MVTIGNGCGNSIRHIGESQEITAKLECLNRFSIGDNMGYVGYATINGTATARLQLFNNKTRTSTLP